MNVNGNYSAGGDGQTFSDGVRHERSRIFGILSCSPGRKRPNLAMHYAYQTSLSFEEARNELSLAACDIDEAPKAVSFGDDDNADQKTTASNGNAAATVDRHMAAIRAQFGGGGAAAVRDRVAAERAAAEAQFGKPGPGMR